MSGDVIIDVISDWCSGYAGVKPGTQCRLYRCSYRAPHGANKPHLLDMWRAREQRSNSDLYVHDSYSARTEFMLLRPPLDRGEPRSTSQRFNFLSAIPFIALCCNPDRILSQPNPRVFKAFSAVGRQRFERIPGNLVAYLCPEERVLLPASPALHSSIFAKPFDPLQHVLRTAQLSSVQLDVAQDLVFLAPAGHKYCPEFGRSDI